MKRILLLAIAISLFGYLTAQNNTWDVYLEGQAVKSIAFENNNVWALRDSSLVRLVKTDGSITIYPFPEIMEDTESTSKDLRICNDRKKWVSYGSIMPTVNSLYSFEGGDWEKHNLPDDFWLLYSIETDKNNSLWLTSAGLGGAYLYKYDGSDFMKFTPENSGLPYNFVWGVTADKSGNIWLGNTDANSVDSYGWSPSMSLVKYDGENWISFHGPSLFYSKLIFDDADNLWIQGFHGFDQDELVKWDLSDKTWTNYLTLNENYTLQTVDGESNLWFVNENNGIAVYKDSDWSFFTMSNSELPSNTVYQIAIDADGTKWIATDNGLARFEELTTGVSVTEKVMPVKFRPTVHGLEISNTEQPAMLSLYDIQGRAIYESTLTPFEIIVTPDLITGVYIVKVSTCEGVFAEKVVVQ